jgi:hypothetical protein
VSVFETIDRPSSSTYSWLVTGRFSRMVPFLEKVLYGKMLPISCCRRIDPDQNSPAGGGETHAF